MKKNLKFLSTRTQANQSGLIDIDHVLRFGVWEIKDIFILHKYLVGTRA